jgi:hypothetical protein
MAAGEQGRSRVTRARHGSHDLATLPGWAQIAVVLGVTAMLCLVAHFAGVPGRWAPLVIGGTLGLMTALVAGAPAREDD